MSKSILIVDDTRSMRAMVTAVLQGAGYSVEAAADGAEALEKAKSRAFDLIVTDYNMPGMDGIALVRSLRELPHYEHIALLVLSTESGAELKTLGRQAGATGWISKPFDPEQMLDIVRQFTE
jgi:two-component system chemotaxis response regulator CheY